MVDTKIGQKTTICGANRCLTIKMKIKMKKTLLMVAAVAMMAFTACNKENIIGGNEVETPTEDSVVSPVSVVEFTASFGATKTTLDEAGEKTLWVASDKISINGEEFEIKELIDGGAAAKFVNVKELPEDFAAPFTAKYPYGVEGIPSTQQATPGTFDPNAALEIAESEDHNLSFTNVASLLKFQVPAACETVTISSDDVLAGSDAKTVTVNGPFATDKTYYVAVLPGTKNNFVVRIDGYLSRNKASVQIPRSTIANMKTLPAPVDSKWRLKGAFDWATGKTFYEDLNGYYVVKNMTFDSTAEIKVHNQDGKDEWLRAAANVALADNWYKLGGYDGGNGRIIKGTYDIYVDPANYYVHFRTAGEKLTEAIPDAPTVTVYLNKTDYTHLWCWNKDKSSENFTGGSWPGQKSSTNDTINGKTYRKWTLTSCKLGVYTNMIFSNNGGSQTGEDGNTGLLMGETMFIKLDNGKACFNNDI